jgi:hypothetical protein
VTLLRIKGILDGSLRPSIVSTITEVRLAADIVFVAETKRRKLDQRLGRKRGSESKEKAEEEEKRGRG